MKYTNIFKSLFLLAGLVVATNVWGETETVTFTSAKWAPWTSNKDGSGFENSGNKRGVANNGVKGSCTSTSSYTGVTSVVLKASANSASGKIQVKVGSTVIETKSISNANDETYTYDVSNLSGTVTVTVTEPGTKTVWVKSVTVNYTGSGGGGGGGTDYSITAHSSNTDMGTVSRSDNVITAHPKTGFKVSATNPYTVSPTGSATVVRDGNVFTVTATANTEITINFETENPDTGDGSEIEVVGITPVGTDYGVIIEHDLPGDASITLSQKEEIQESGDPAIADELFFSKYFEADSENKLIAIFNGTTEKIALSNYQIKRSHRTGASSATEKSLELSSLGRKETGYIYPREEIIIVLYSSSNSAKPCAQKQKGYEDWYDADDLDAKDFMSFSGPMSIGLYKKSVSKYIDVIGATTQANGKGKLVQINASNNANCTYAKPHNEQYNDAPGGFYSDEGWNIKTGQGNYFLSTNRCLLIRNNTVVSGEKAVQNNVYTAQIECSEDVVHAFVTLGGTLGEWKGFRIGKGSDASDLTCEGLGYVGGFDYSQYYVNYTPITTETTLESTKQPDGTSVIIVPDMKDRACKELKIEVKGGSLDHTITKLYDVPIIVDATDVKTDDARFNKLKDTCKICDVVVLDGASLTKVNDNNKHYGDSARIVDVYAGGKLVIPSGKKYYAEEVILRTQSTTPSLWTLKTPEVVFNTNNSQIVKPNSTESPVLAQRVRLETGSGTGTDLNFYMVSFPFNVTVADVTFSDGTPAELNTDFFIYYYNGETRAASQNAYGNWVAIPASTTELEAGKGYLVAAAERPGHQYRELYFPMNNPALNVGNGEPDNKITSVNAWGWGETIRPNHKGWNFISNPYLRDYQKNKLSGDNAFLSLDFLVQGEDGYWSLSGTAPTIPYVTILNSNGTDYTQVKVADAQLKAFTPFFVQIGTGAMISGEGAQVQFKAANRVAAAPGRRMTTDRPTVSSLGLLIEGAEEIDNCGIVIGEQYGPAYELMADLSKEFGSAYSLKAYTLQDGDNMRLAFHAMHPDRLTNTIPVGVRMPATAEYTFRIDKRYDLSDFEHVWLHDAETGEYTDLLYNDYTFNGTKQQNDNRFKLTVALRPKTPTDVDHVLSGIFVNGRDGALMISGLPEEASVYVYDLNGRLLVSDHTQRLNTAIYPLSTGVYQVRVEGNGQNALLKAIVK